MPMRPYVVRQGDYLTKIATALGFDARAVWQHADNRELRERRTDPEVLSPGDVLQVPVEEEQPGASFSAGGTRQYRARVPRLPLRVVLRRGSEPIAGEAFVALGIGRRPVTGTTGADGAVELQVPVHVREITLRLPERHESYRLLVGHMDPIDEPSGLCARLRHLGLLPDPARSGAETLPRHPFTCFGPSEEEDLDAAVRAVQARHGLPESGAVDEATTTVLAREHDSEGR